MFSTGWRPLIPRLSKTLSEPERIGAVGLRELRGTAGTDSGNTGAEWGIFREWAGLFVEKRENRGCHAQNQPRDEQGVNCKLNEVTPVSHTLPSARKGTEQESDSL